MSAAIKNERPATAVQRRRAKRKAKPTYRTRAAAQEIGQPETVVRLQKATPGTSLRIFSPSAAIIPGAMPVPHVADDAKSVSPPVTKRRKAYIATHSDRNAKSRSLSVAQILEMLQNLQRRRKHAIKMQSILDRSIENFLAGEHGYRVDADDLTKQAVFAKARADRLRIEEDCHDVVDLSTLDAVDELVMASARSRIPWDERRKKDEKDMERLVMLLPIGPWVKSVRGLGALGAAAIIGESNIPIGDYRTVSGLWSRFGLAVIDGRTQRRVSGQAAMEHNYSPERRAQLWAFTDSMFRHQWTGDRDEDGNPCSKTGKPVAVPAHALGPYGEAYGRRYAYMTAINSAGGYAARVAAIIEEQRKRAKPGWMPHPDHVAGRLTKQHINNDAKRIMAKQLLRDLWREWRRLDRGEPVTS